jgi:outer membrane receptor protein involved in Fe transport
LQFGVGPRIGISHPISENAKIYFNYGYFFQRANTTDLMLQTINPFWPVLSINNPNLKLRKNINYEFAVEHNIANRFTYRVVGYYKDVYNEVGDVEYIPMVGTYPTGDTNGYKRPENNIYRDIRGVEVEVTGNFLRYFQTRVNYNYMITRRGNYGYNKIYQDPFVENELKDPDANQPKPRPIFRATLMFTTPIAGRQSSFLSRLVSDIQVYGHFRWEAGEWFEYTRGSWGSKFPEEDDNLQWKPYHNGIDLKAFKGFKVAGLTMRAYINISNVLNSKQLLRSAFWHVRNPGFTEEDYMDYLELKGKYEPGWYDDELEDILMRATPYYAIFKMPRTIFYGLEIEF